MKKQLVRIFFDDREEMSEFLSKHLAKEDIVNIESKFFLSPTLIVNAYAEGKSLEAIKSHNQQFKKEFLLMTIILFGFLASFIVGVIVWHLSFGG